MNLKELHKEFLQLKAELFGNDKFIVVDDSVKQQRYDYLLGLFYPQFRTGKYDYSEYPAIKTN